MRLIVLLIIRKRFIVMVSRLTTFARRINHAVFNLSASVSATSNNVCSIRSVSTFSPLFRTYLTEVFFMNDLHQEVPTRR